MAEPRLLRCVSDSSDKRWLSLGDKVWAQHEREPAMWSQRTLLGLVVGCLFAASASAQAGGALRWRGAGAPASPYASSFDVRAACGPSTLACGAETASAPLWISAKAPRAVLMEVAYLDQYSALRSRQQAMNLSVVGKAGLPYDLGVYGRVGTYLQRNEPGLAPAAFGDGAGLSYGLGLSWDFSRRGSAIVGWDSYDLRPEGSWRASLGLQWRY